jgi:hypothetical protein
MTEIQGAIEKLPQREKKALADWLSSQEHDESHDWLDKLAEMAADPQMRAEVRRINHEFATAEADGLGKV